MKKRLFCTLLVCAISYILMTNETHADYFSEDLTLFKGMRNTEVSELQSDLKELGYYYLNATGYFGSVTKDAVIRYQLNNKLSVDGVVGPKTAKEIKIDSLLETANDYLEVPYVWGGTSPEGFDCSGFSHYVFLENEMIIPRVSSLQYTKGTWVPREQLIEGDLVFFTTYKPGPSHLGIYLGNNKFIHASSGAGMIVISDITKYYYDTHYIGAKRIIQ